MKANAPEKIYLRHNHKGDIGAGWLIFPLINNDIEYTRTDAFIEKAKKWFEENFMNGHKWEILTYEFKNIQSMIDEFRKYMEGE